MGEINEFLHDHLSMGGPGGQENFGSIWFS